MIESHEEPAWIDEFAAQLGKAPDSKVVQDFLARAHAGYLERSSAKDAAFDRMQIALIESSVFGNAPDLSRSLARPGVEAGNPKDPESIHRMVFVSPTSPALGTVRLKRYGTRGVELSRLVHTLESLGFAVVEDSSSVFPATGNLSIDVHMDDLELRWANQERAPLVFDMTVDGQRVAEALAAIDMGQGEIDLLNRLTVSAGLSWRQVALIRAYRCYRLQLSSEFSSEQLDQTLFLFPEITSTLVRYFEARFDPDSETQNDDTEKSREKVMQLLKSVISYTDDQILRGYLELIDETVRTNYFARNAGKTEETLVLKFTPSRATSILHHSMLEIFVFGTGVMGIHLRAGKVARGGIRWSERIEDFRTEIYDLALAQIKKNAVIVPTGAKGGFVLRNSASPAPALIEEAYKNFITSLLEITDNVVQGKTITPDRVLAYDGDDHYLVVAADKGTASFSDLANSISLERGYWLGDAFASGGSNGYDHKALAITARGAWIAVRRHFKKLGIDADNEPLLVVGVGDMSGDIFGNGMLQSSHIKLVAAFDHRHVFIDPDPDPEKSFAERRRLAKLERSSWDDYDRQLISTGGGVWPRSSKEIPLTAEARRSLNIEGASVSPFALISAILSAPSDLIWFGGIGTYLKDKNESDEEVGDSANDSVRISADKIRARVIAEGANLAVTQRGRIRYARRGGRVDTDFIDNAGGVAMSDYEVNLKILLDMAVNDGLLSRPERDRLLKDASNEAVRKVLRQVEDSIAAIDRGLEATAQHLDACEALIESWEELESFDRSIDFLPDSEEFEKRRSAQAGLTRPELAVLQSYSKSYLAISIRTDRLAGDASLSELVKGYFPPSIADRFEALLHKHPLYEDLVATTLAGEMINRMGVVWAHEIAEELAHTFGDIAKAFWVACKVSRAFDLWNRLDELDQECSEDDVMSCHRQLMVTVDALTRLYLAQPDERIRDLGALISSDGSALSDQASTNPDFQAPAEPPDIPQPKNIPSDFLAELRSFMRTPLMIEAVDVSRQSGADIHRVISLAARIDEVAHIDKIRGIIDSIPVENRWISWQVSGLNSDLVRWRKQECIALISSSEKSGLDDAVSLWKAAHLQSFNKITRLLDAASQGKGDPLTLISLVVRELRVAT